MDELPPSSYCMLSAPGGKEGEKNVGEREGEGEEKDIQSEHQDEKEIEQTSNEMIDEQLNLLEI